MPAAGPLRAAGGHLTADNTPTARREPAQTPAPDTRERDAGGIGARSPMPAPSGPGRGRLAHRGRFRPSSSGSPATGRPGQTELSG